MGKSERARQLRWLMILRVVTITTLLVSAFAVELILLPTGLLSPLFLVAALAYSTVLLYAVLDRWLAGHRIFLYIQLIGDAALMTAFVGITGGLASPMSFLYLLPIGVAGLLLYRRGGLVVAMVSWLFWLTLIGIVPRWLSIGIPLEQWLERDPGRGMYALLVHPIGMFAVAWFASYLSERLKSQGDELQERRGAVLRLKALNENIIESINSGLITTDREGVINFINRGGAEIVQHESGRVFSQKVESFLQFPEGMLSDIRKRLAVNRRFRFERYFVDGEGRRIFLGIAVSVLHDKVGQPLGFIFIFQDLTEINALEQEVRLHERMAALGEMAAGMAHELRNPLASISGAVQYLKDEIPPGGETFDMMDIILRESQRLDQAIKDFLTFAKPGPFHAMRTDLGRLLRDAARLLEKSREFRGHHQIELELGDAPLAADVDSDRIRQVFWNLASNALKAMPEGGTLTIGMHRPTGQERDEVEIYFRDQGRGMCEDDRERYFQPFQSSFREGSGLGAAIVYRLVKEHGGRIGLDSTPGEGTCIRVVLPRFQLETEKAGAVPITAHGSTEARRS
jgi:two-component system sensor histidine kinase PilS (NtrC family)